MRDTGCFPKLVIKAGGELLAPEALKGLAKVCIRQRLSLPSQCELTLHEPPGPLDVVSRFTLGTALQVELQEHHTPLFKGQVTAVEQVYGPSGEREVFIRCYDLLHQLQKRQSARAFVQVTLQELAKELVADIGLTVKVEGETPLWQRIFQHCQTDLEFLAGTAEQCGFYLTLRGDELNMITLEGIGPELPLILGESLLEARIEINSQAACSEVSSVGWNTLFVEVYEGNASSPRVGLDVSAEVAPASVGGGKERVLLHNALQDKTHAEAVAQAELDRLAAHEVIFWGVAGGNPDLRPGALLNIKGVSDQVAGTYTVTEVIHTIDEIRGFVSEISSSPPPRFKRLRSAVAAMGKVTRVDDPDDLGRIKVSLPTYGDVETEWMHVLSAGAGKGKGLTVLPDVGDSVLVLFSHEDPGQGIVLGGLYGMDGPPDSGVEGKAVLRYTFLTPQGQRIRLDDAGKAIRMENSGGSYIDISPDKLKIHAAVDLELEAPGKSVIIRGESIDFQRAR